MIAISAATSNVMAAAHIIGVLAPLESSVSRPKV